MNKFVIVYILDDNYWYPVVVSAKSALLKFEESDGSRLEFIFIEDRLSETHKQTIHDELESPWSTVRFVSVDMGLFERYPSYHGSKLVWTRCRINSILPDVDGWVCVCDGDTLWLKSPRELFALTERADDGDLVVFGSDNYGNKDGMVDYLELRGIHIPWKTYFCMGFAMLHLGRMKRCGAERLCDEFVQEFGPPDLNEQDIFNYIFLNRKKILPTGWGASPNTGMRRIRHDELAVIHYYGSLPWPASWFGRASDAEALWWHFARKFVSARADLTKYRTSYLQLMLMRGCNCVVRVLPSAALGKRMKDVRLPIAEWLESYGRLNDKI